MVYPSFEDKRSYSEALWYRLHFSFCAIIDPFVGKVCLIQHGKIIPDEIYIKQQSVLQYCYIYSKRFNVRNDFYLVNISANKYVQRYIKLDMQRNIRAYTELLTMFCDYIRV